MKNFLLLIALFCSISFAQAQYEAVFGHYVINPILINPSVAGFNSTQNIQMNVRNQWTGFPNSPKTYAVSYNGPIGKTLGIGVGVLSETIAQLTRVRFQLNYAFRYNIKGVDFAAGFSTEFLSQRIPNSVMDNRLYQPGDFVIEDAVEGTRFFDASLGAYGKFPNGSFLGMTFTNLVAARLDDIGGTTSEGGSFFQYVILNAGHEFDLDDYNFKLEPSMMLSKIRNVPFRVDFNVIAKFLDDALNAGLSYKAGSGGALGILLGTKVSAIRVFYSYDVFFGKFQSFNGGTHELTVGFNFEKRKKRFDRNENYRN